MQAGLHLDCTLPSVLLRSDTPVTVVVNCFLSFVVPRSEIQLRLRKSNPPFPWCYLTKVQLVMSRKQPRICPVKRGRLGT